MRIATSQIFEAPVRQMQQQQSQLQQTELQISTGLRVLKPSDDPVAASRILNLEENIGVLDQFDRNASLAISQLGLAENAYDRVVSELQRVRELTVQGANATLSATDRNFIALELQERLQELVTAGNTRDGNGEYIFGGTQVSQPPFAISGGALVYSGDQQERLLPIGEGTQVQVRDSGDEVFLRIGGSSKDVFAMVQDVITALQAPQPDAASRAAFNTAMQDGLNDMDLALDHMGQLRTRVGSRQNTLDNQLSINADFKLNLQEVLSDTRDVDYAEAISRFNQQLTSLQAAQQAFVQVQGLSLFNYL